MQRDLDAKVVAALLEQEAWVRRLARCLLGGDADVDDVVQQTYLRALTYPPAPGTRVRQWIAQITRNVVRQRWNKAGRAPATDLPSDLAGSTAPAAELVGEIELQRRIAGIVLALDEPYRTAIVLRYYDNQTPIQIAAALDCPVETVRTRVKRGLARIRSEMDRESRECRDGKPWQAAVLAMLEGGPGAGPGAPGRHAQEAQARLGAGRRWAVGATVAGLLVFGLGSLIYFLAHSAPPESEPRSSTVFEQAATPSHPGLEDGLVATSPSGLVADQASIEPAPMLAAGGEHRMTGTVVSGISGTPIARADVLVGVWDGEKKSYRTAATVTDDAGQFDVTCDELVDSLPDLIGTSNAWTGSAFVSVTASGFAPALVRLRGEQEYPTDTWRAGRAFAAGSITMFAGARLAGRASVMATGAPVPDGTVFLCEQYSGGGINAYTKQVAKTLADGTWSVDNVVPPRSDAAEPRTLIVISPSQGVVARPLVVDAAPGMLVCDVEFPEPGQLDVFVADELGQPVSGAVVLARPIESFYWASGPPLAMDLPGRGESHEPGTLCGFQQDLILDFLRGLTGSDGHALLPLLPMGRGDRQPGGEAPPWFNGFEVCGGIAGRCHGDSPPLVVLAGKRVAITLIARPQVRAESSVAGHVTDESGGAIGGARVVAAVNSGLPAEAATDDAGFYSARLDPRLDETVLCRASAPGFAPRELEAHVDQLSHQAAVDFVLAHCEPIRGRIIDEQGKPVPGVDLFVRASSDPAPPYPLAPDRIPNGGISTPTTDGEGRFVIANTAAGAWALSTVAPPERKLGQAAVIVRGGTQDVIITLTGDPRPPSDVLVTVGTSDGSRLPPASAALTSLADRPQFFPGPLRKGGACVFEAVAPGPWRVWASAAGGDCGFRDVEVGTDGDPIQVEVVVGPPGAIRVEPASAGEGVVDIRRTDAGPPTEWLTEDMREFAWGQAMQRRTDPAGICEVAGLAPGLYAVRMTRGSEVACSACVVISGQTASLRLDLALRGQVRVSLEGVDQGEWVEIRLCRGDGWMDKNNMTSGDEPWVADLPAGHFEWRVIRDLSRGRTSRRPPQQGSIDIVAGEVRNLVITPP